MVLSTLQTIALIVGIAYYLFIMRNSQRSQQLQLETRQAQLLSGFSSVLITSDSLWDASVYWFDQPKIEWEEFKEQYPRGSDGFDSLMRIFSFFEMIGLLSRKGLVDVELVHELLSSQWEKFKPIVKCMQEEWGSPKWLEYYEWLGEAWLGLLEEEFFQDPRYSKDSTRAQEFKT